jgi:hypothetical protein
MAQRLFMLTRAQEARLPEHAARWIEIGLRTGAAQRPAFERAAQRCYEHAQLRWHERVVWVGSPLVIAHAAPILARLMPAHRSIPVPQPREHLPGDVVTGDADSLMRVLAAALSETVHRAVGHVVSNAAYCSALNTLCGAVERAVDGALCNPTRDAVHEALRHAPQKAEQAAVSRAVHEALGHTPPAELLREAMAESACGLPRWYGYFNGQFAVGGWRWGGAVLSSFLREVCRLELPGDLWDRSRAYEETVQSACWWYPHRDFLLVCERPREIHLEAVSAAAQPSQRLHRTDGPALSWPDGWSVHAVHGRLVPGWIIEHPEELTVQHIEHERNTEVRRVMLERYGFARYIAECGAEVVDTVPTEHEIEGLRGARLLRKLLPGEPEPIVYLEMLNSTAEPDGSHRRYLERIDPKAYDGAAGRLCHAAMASRWHHRDEHGQLQRTFVRWQDYRPTCES